MTFEGSTLPPEPDAAGLVEVRRAIIDLIDLWPRMVGTAKSPFRSDIDVRRAVSIHAHAHHAIQLARALVVLDQTRSEIAMVPTIRAIFEMGVVAAWLLVTPGSGNILIREGAKKRKVAQEALIRMGVDADPGYTQSLSVLAELDAPAISFEVQCRALNGGESLYVTYRAMSAEAHAGLGIADAYFVEDDKSPIGVAFDPMATVSDRDAYLGVAACMLFLAVNADETARQRPRVTTQLRKIARRLGVGTAITRADGTTVGPPSP